LLTNRYTSLHVWPLPTPPPVLQVTTSFASNLRRDFQERVLPALEGYHHLFLPTGMGERATAEAALSGPGAESAVVDWEAYKWGLNFVFSRAFDVRWRGELRRIVVPFAGPVQASVSLSLYLYLSIYLSPLGLSLSLFLSVRLEVTLPTATV
jgi:hypothetical protein